MNHQFWLAKLDQHGNPTLIDGAHAERSGVEKAMYLFNRLNLSKGENYACAEVFITPVNAKAHGANEDAIETLNAGRSALQASASTSHGGEQPLLVAPRVDWADEYIDQLNVLCEDFGCPAGSDRLQWLHDRLSALQSDGEGE